MAHFSRTNPGGWATLDVLTAAQLNDLDIKTSKALNGDEGGSWAPSAAIVIGGQGLQCPAGATWTVLGTFEVDGEIDLTNIISVSGTASVGNGGSFTWQLGSSTTWATGSFFTWSAGANVSLAATMHVTGQLSLEAANALHSTTANALQVNGASIHILDGTDPTYETPRARDIVQPLIAYGPGAGGAVDLRDGYLVDGAGGLVYRFPLTKLVNGSKLSDVLIFYAPDNGTPVVPTVGALIELHRVTSTVTNLGTGACTVTDATLASTGAIFPLYSGGAVTCVSFATLSSWAGDVVDDSKCTYYVKVTSESGTTRQDLRWYPFVARMTNITSAQQP